MLKPKKRRTTGRKKLSNAIFSVRPERMIICPKCATAQSREQDFCCCCGTMFIFLDETNRFCT